MLQDTVIQLYKKFNSDIVNGNETAHAFIFSDMHRLISENEDKKTEIINLFCEMIEQNNLELAARPSAF